MVKIEVDEDDDRVSNPPKPSSSQKDHDEGFETASDGEFGGSDDDDHHTQPPQETEEQNHHSQSDQQEEQVVSRNDDDELNQKSLAQANDVKLEGNQLYSNGQFEEALSKYELALQLAPEMTSSVEIRSTCHSNRAICYLKLGKYEETVKECTKALELNPSYIKALLRRGEAHEKLDHFEEAIADMKKILELDPSNDQARKSIRRLEPLAEEKREKMKEEMIGKLKEMGNSLLGRFGMSVDNFKAVKDPNTGSYSVSFQP
ncbi:uncharacterized protein LOC133778602 [Humulus lupulus]|uniref:uncharacterized protein LOC133778602 n=1 Tax=Humulus lupulus TaxID=3486 RepID=UPI002B40C4EC|nr:uncharacterized protein LOC133778602 [Humulus lupulus]